MAEHSAQGHVSLGTGLAFPSRPQMIPSRSHQASVSLELTYREYVAVRSRSLLVHNRYVVITTNGQCQMDVILMLNEHHCLSVNDVGLFLGPVYCIRSYVGAAYSQQVSFRYIMTLPFVVHSQLSSLR